MRSLTVILFLLVGINSNAEEIYVQMDEYGVPSYSDHSTPTNTRIEVKNPVTYSDPSIYANSEKNYEADSANGLQQRNYSARITHPPNDSAVRNNSGSLSLKVSIEPSLEEGYTAQLLRDGIVIRDIKGTSEIHLKNLDRGTHAFKVRIRNQTDEIVFGGTTTRITLLRHSIQN